MCPVPKYLKKHVGPSPPPPHRILILPQCSPISGNSSATDLTSQAKCSPGHPSLFLLTPTPPYSIHQLRLCDFYNALRIHLLLITSTTFLSPARLCKYNCFLTCVPASLSLASLPPFSRRKTRTASHASLSLSF